jgi:hypothetical protein
MVKSRRGAGSLGCLFTLLIVAAIGYFGLPIAEVYFRYWQFEDEMSQAVRFARVNPDREIRSRLQTFVDSAGLPSAARNIQIQRRNGRIDVSASYIEEFHLPGYVRVQAFNPAAQGSY